MAETFQTSLTTPLQYVKGVGPVRSKLLERLNLLTIQDLLLHFPIAHKDRATVTPIAKLRAGSDANIVAQIIDVRGKQYGGKEKIEALLGDASGQIRAVWWSPYVAEKLDPDCWAFFSGKVAFAGNRVELASPEFEVISEPGEKPDAATGPSLGRIVPVYNLRPKQRLDTGEEAPEIRINQNFLRKLVWNALEQGAAEQLEDQLPPDLRGKLNLPPLAAAIRQIHFPDSFTRSGLARKRLVYEELLIIALGVALRRAQVERLAASKEMPLTPAIEKRIAARLPFTLTPSQQAAFKEIAADMAGQHPMSRLLQGDVGSGKTAVAVAALLLCVAHGAQAALLAPTEVLAEQHARTITDLLKDSRVNIRLLRGGLTGPARQEFLRQLAAGDIHISIGTHALLEEDVIFKALGLVVVDEQHKFGVAQRMSLRGKGRAPHVLVMTATPIPRTLTLTLYGDLDVSVIKEPPPGRGETITRLLQEDQREKAYELMRAEARQKRVSYIVLPRIEGGNGDDLSPLPPPGGGVGGEGNLPTRAPLTPNPSPLSGARGEQRRRAPRMLWNEVKGVEEELKKLRAQLPDLRFGLLHGRMASDEKERVVRDLREGRLDALVSTQVIEVGIDLPQASVMLIENAEMFGLSALHQLRGRVGRSGHRSYCLVFSRATTEEAGQRLKIFAETRNGFDIAEADFKLRGPGQFFGTQQSGLPELRIADLLKDEAVLRDARREAFEIVRQDARLLRPEHAGLKRRVREVLGARLGLVDVG